MQEFPEDLTDGHLTLRPALRADLSAVARQLNDPRVARWLAAVSYPFDPEELLTHGDHPGEALRLIEIGGDMAGGLCVGSTLWYWLTPERCREGIMNRALRLALTTRFASPAPPLHATCHEENHASRALLSGLGFAPLPGRRRMFFHGTGRSEPCRDYLLAPEQWHLLNPPEIMTETAWLRPALQKDASALMSLLPVSPENIWPGPEALASFLERHRYRGGATGLFAVVDELRRTVGMALIGHGAPQLRFLTPADEQRHRPSVEAGLGDFRAQAFKES
jgi:RimJ/RimL family protein N-acetyltransferase